MERFPSFSFLSSLASNPRSFSCFSRMLFIDSFMAAFFSRVALGCLPSHYALFSGDLAITLFFLKGSASLSYQGSVWRPSTFAGADRSLFAGVAPCTIVLWRRSPACHFPAWGIQYVWTDSAGKLDLSSQ